jgi:hypothetical protein
LVIAVGIGVLAKRKSHPGMGGEVGVFAADLRGIELLFLKAKS